MLLRRLCMLAALCGATWIAGCASAVATYPERPPYAASQEAPRFPFVLKDSRPPVEIAGELATDDRGHRSETLGDAFFSPTIVVRLARSVEESFGNEAAGKTLEVFATRVYTAPNPDGTEFAPGMSGVPHPTQMLGLPTVRAMDNIFRGRAVYVTVAAALDGVEFAGRVHGTYRTNLQGTADALVKEAIWRAVNDLRKKKLESP